MHATRTPRHSALLALAFAAACSGEIAAPSASTNVLPSPPKPAPLTQPNSLPLSHDEELLRIAEATPGFAGMHVERGRLVVTMTGRGERARMDRALAPLWPRLGGVRRDFVVRRGRYDFAQLYAWKNQARAAFAAGGMQSLDIDEMRNRLRIGVTDASRQPAIEQELIRRNVPLDAVVIEQEKPLELLQSVHDFRRPTIAGLEISRGPSDTLCTLGAVVDDPNDALFGLNRRYFLTASHCSSNYIGPDNTVFWQPGPTGSRIGVEVRDPVGFTTVCPDQAVTKPDGNRACCPFGWTCRWSDATLVQFDDPSLGLRGLFAQTTIFAGEAGRDPVGTISSLWSGNSFYAQDGSWPLLIQGVDNVHKLGRTTGWTGGSVSGACVDIAPRFIAHVFFCQTSIRAHAEGGDSGGPALIYGADGQVAFYGIVFASDGTITSFSPVPGIVRDLGRLTYNPVIRRRAVCSVCL